ncbi:MAG TPA: dTDP-glucose 4,6-dehydratase [Planctomycetaceae bacterium]|nr:dTDP-glucose 4,6-dehydratase [Planctomycetaceae bacterium]HIQ20332.1 dTDP-glucose 4,6-dehydratase [Planctomycetota bacterium]
MKAILVTGGAGFIGGHFVRRWLAEEDGLLVNLDKLSYASSLQRLEVVADNPRYQFVHGDVCDGNLVYELVASHRVSAIVHLAAETHVDRSIDDPADFVRTNVEGTFQVLEAARRWWRGLNEPARSEFRVVQVSTDEVYGSIDSASGGQPDRATEDSPCAPNSPYAASKAAADHLARAYWRTYGLPVVITLGCNTYGPYQFPEKLVPLVILNALEGRPLPVYGDGQQIRDWLHVEDHCRALRAVFARGKPGQRYNIGAECQRTNLEVVRTITAIIDRLVPDLPHAPCGELVTFVADRPGHDRRYAMDTTKIRTELGWQPQVDFTQGMEQTVRWYLENRAWAEQVAAGKYDRQRLGLGPA